MALHFLDESERFEVKNSSRFLGIETKMIKHACKFDVEHGSSDVLHYTRLIQMCRSSGSIFGLPVPYLVLQHAVTSLNHKMARLEGCEVRQYHVGLNSNIVTLNWLLRYSIPLKPHIYIYMHIYILLKSTPLTSFPSSVCHASSTTLPPLMAARGTMFTPICFGKNGM